MCRLDYSFGLRIEYRYDILSANRKIIMVKEVVPQELSQKDPREYAREQLLRIDRIAEFALLTLGNSYGRGNSSLGFDFIEYKSLPMHEVCEKIGLVDFKKIKNDLSLLYGGAVNPCRSDVSFDTKKYNKKADIKDGNDGQKRRLVIGFPFDLESPTRTEKDVTSEGYPIYPIVDQVAVTIVIPTQIGKREIPRVIKRIVDFSQLSLSGSKSKADDPEIKAKFDSTEELKGEQLEALGDSLVRMTRDTILGFFEVADKVRADDLRFKVMPQRDSKGKIIFMPGERI